MRAGLPLPQPLHAHMPSIVPTAPDIHSSPLSIPLPPVMALGTLLRKQYASVSISLLDVSALRPRQTTTLYHINSPMKPHELLPEERTGGGWTRIFKVTAIAKQEITFTLKNLYPLFANLHSKFNGTSQAHILVSAYNLTKVILKSKVMHSVVVYFAVRLGWNTMSTVLLLSPP